MKKFFEKLLKVLTRPFVSIGINQSTERMIKFLNRHPVIYYIMAFILTALTIFLLAFFKVVK